MSTQSSILTGLGAPHRMPRLRTIFCAFFLALFLTAACTVMLALPLAAQSPNEALFNAVEVNDIDAVETAISSGADLTAKNAEGMTPADVAVDLGHFRIAHILLSKRTQPPSPQSAPRVTEKIKDALTQPKKRVADPRSASRPVRQPEPDPKLSDLTPPIKPEPASTAMAPPAMSPPAPEAVAPQPERAPMPKSADAETPVIAPETKPAIKKAPPPPDMRPDDEIADAAPMKKLPAKDPDAAPAEEGGFLSSIWGGIREATNFGDLFGSEQTAAEKQTRDFGSDGQRLSNPADRFSNPPSPSRMAANERESSAGRMVDRMAGLVGSDKPAENAFGLPEGPVVAPLPDDATQAPGIIGISPLPATPGDQPALGIPELGIPDLGTETAEIPVLAPPPINGPDAVPGLAVPVLPPDGEGVDSVDIPGLPAELSDPGTPGVAEPGIPGLAVPELPDGPAPPDPDIPGLPPGLDMPGLAAPTGEVPGIIPPPADTADAIPALPPGLAQLPGSTTGQLRRPGGLVEPEDPNVLPPPGGGDLQSRLSRIDKILNRTPTQNSDRYLIPRGTRATDGRGTPRTAPEKAPVSEKPAPDPFMEIPKGLETPRTAPRSRLAADDRDDPAEILRRARESEAVMREREIQNAKPGRNAKNVPRPLRPSGHQLPLPEKPVTSRKEPSSRLMARLGNLTGRQYEDEDIHGLPIVRPSIDNTVPPRKDITVAGIPADVAVKTDVKLQRLARFFRGDQEEEAGMKAPAYKAPEQRVEKEPLARVIDNLLPENDPARAQIVDDKLLDLTGVELRPDPAGTQPGASQSTSNKVDQTFLDRLTTVLGPARRANDIPTAETGEPGTIGLGQLDVPGDQMIKPVKPQIPDPWTMTVERKDAEGQKQTLGVTAISPEDGSEIRTEQGVMSGMVGRIRQLFKGPKDLDRGPQIEKLDDADRQAAAERLLSDALRDGAPTALPDQGQWPVTEIETINATPGVPPAPRPGVLTRTSLDDVVLSLGESVTLENTLPPQQDGIDPLNACVKKNRGTTLFCVEPIDWPQELRTAFVVPTILYTGPSAITRYDQGSPSRFHALFSSEQFEQIVAYYQVRYGEPTEIWKRSIAPLAKPRMDNPTVTWRSRDSQTNVISVLEVRKFDDTRGGFPDTTRGAVMLYHFNAPSIFPQVSSHELMRLRRAR